MGIQINGSSDIISANDGGLTIQGQSIENSNLILTQNLNVSGVGTFGRLSGGTANNFDVGDINTGCSITSGTNNNFLGACAGQKTTTGSHNNFFGLGSGQCNTTGTNNFFVGNLAGRCNVSGSQNNFFGEQAGAYNSTGAYNNIFGQSAGRATSANPLTGCHNNFFGKEAGRYSTGAFHNNFFGLQAGYCNSSGNYNNFFGRCVGRSNTTGTHNNFFGNSAGFANTTGSNNNFLGNCAGRSNTTGGCNNFLGYYAGGKTTTGACNTFIGRYAGCSNTTGSHNVAIGNNAQLPSATGSCQLVIGSAGVNWIYGDSAGNIGLGAATPTQKLTIYDGSILVGTTPGSNTSGEYEIFRGFAYVTGGTLYGSVALKSTYDNVTNASSLNFYTSSGGTSQGTRRMTLDSSGRLGIGTVPTGASAKLFVASNALSSGSSSSDGGIVLTPTTSLSTGQYTPAISFSPNPGAPERSRAGIAAVSNDATSGMDLVFLTRYGADATELILSTNEKVRITSVGRIGIGVTAPIAQTHIRLSAVTGYTSPSNDGLVIERGGGNDLGITIATDNTRNGYLIFADGDSANPAWVGYDHSANAMSFRVNASERARIDSSGRLLVGTSSSPSAGQGANSRLVVQGYVGDATDIGVMSIQRGEAAASITSGEALGRIAFNDNAGNSFAYVEAYADAAAGANDFPGRLVFSTTADGASSPTERMRIGQNGSVQIGRSTGQIETELLTLQNGGQCGWIYQTANSNVEAITIRHTYAQSAQTAKMIRFLQNNGAEVGAITSSTTATAYGTSSDYRLKENVTVVTDGISRLQQLKPSRFNFIVDPDKTVDGFLAHEVQTVVPEAITGTKDAVDDDGNPVYQGIDQSKLVPLLTAALQEAIGEIESLKARLTAAGI